MKVLFVCSGNTCRSPMAEVIARRIAREDDLADAEFRSAGTSTVSGLSASEGALRAAERHGLELNDHTSTPLSRDLIAWADMVLTMGTSHLIWVTDQGGEGKSALLGSVLAEDTPEYVDYSVPDPFGGGDDIYEATFIRLESLVKAALQRMAGEEME